jgi:threonine dehydrogenase-like Zn-dependent dehydrogenase
MKALQFNVSIPQFLALKIFGAGIKRAHYSGPISAVRMADINEPELPSPDWVKIKVRRCGVCASDVNTIMLKNSPAWSAYTSFPSVLGHEIAGTVVEAGAEVPSLQAGDLVSVCPLLNCKVRGIEPECQPCRQGLSCCENFAEGKLPPGTALDVCVGTLGGYSEYIIAHKSQVFKIPQGISPEAAALIEPLAIALEAVLSNRPQKDEQVLVIGGGVIGNMVIHAIRALDIPCKITTAVSSNFTAELARKSGADHTISGKHQLEEAAEITGGKCYIPLLGPTTMMRGFDRVYDCLSKSDSITMALRAVKTGGVVSLIGLSSEVKFDPTMIWVKLITIMGSLYYGFHDWEGKRKHTFEIAIDLITKKDLKLQDMVTHKFKLAEYKKMMDVNIHKGKYKAVKTMFVYD